MLVDTMSLSRLTKETLAYNKQLGSTGEGLRSEDINFGDSNSLTNAWSK